MTRYQLARRQVQARQNGQTGLFRFLLAVGCFCMAGGAIANQIRQVGHAFRSGNISSSLKTNPLQKTGRFLAEDAHQHVAGEVSKAIAPRESNERD